MTIKVKATGRAYKVPVKVLASEPDDKYAYIMEPLSYDSDQA